MLPSMLSGRGLIASFRYNTECTHESVLIASVTNPSPLLSIPPALKCPLMIQVFDSLDKPPSLLHQVIYTS